jgi:hypothetical protein
MKSERRHDLETNELAVRVQDWLDRVKPYASQIALVLLGVAVLAYMWSEWGNVTSATEQAAWDEYTLASYSSDPELNSMKLLAENEEYAGTPVPEWAYLSWCDRQLLLSSQSFLIDRTATVNRLEKVQEIYQTLANDSGNSQVQERARFGLAQSLEMQGKLDEARAVYQRVKGDLTPLATSRAEQVQSDKVKEAYSWLTTAELPKRETPSTGGAAAGTRPNFGADIPAPMPSSNPLKDTRSLEEILGSSTGDASDANRYGEGTEADAAADTVPADSVPADSAPADAVPAYGGSGNADEASESGNDEAPSDETQSPASNAAEQ